MDDHFIRTAFTVVRCALLVVLTPRNRTHPVTLKCIRCKGQRPNLRDDGIRIFQMEVLNTKALVSLSNILLQVQKSPGKFTDISNQELSVKSSQGPKNLLDR